MPDTNEQNECSECGLRRGHKMSCVSGNEQAQKYQGAMERRHATKELAEIRECDKCELCEDHHA